MSRSIVGVDEMDQSNRGSGYVVGGGGSDGEADHGRFKKDGVKESVERTRGGGSIVKEVGDVKNKVLRI